jgi:hypothetical protein
LTVEDRLCDYRLDFHLTWKERTGVALEWRMKRAERMLKMFARQGRKYRSEFRSRHREMEEKIDILINTQIDTNEQLKRTDEQIQRTGEQIEALAAKTEQAVDRLAAGQVKTDKALERFLNGLSKGRNGNSSD